MIVKDLRGKNRKEEANAHTEMLEEKLEIRKKYRILTRFQRITGQVYDLAETAGAGYLAGYIASRGDLETATQFSEYATVLWGGFILGVAWPLKYLLRKHVRNIEDKVDKERTKADELEIRGQFHKYKPEEGLDFKNHGSNYDNLVENSVQSNYWGNLETARKPVRRAIRNCLYGALGMWFASLIIDTETNIIDLVSPNPIEKGLELTHYLFGQIEPLKNYLTQTTHNHIGDFNQMHMAGIGFVCGALTTTKEFVKGKYQQVRAKLRKK